MARVPLICWVLDVRIVPSRIKGAEDGIMSRNQSGEVIFFPLVSSA
jgi:hypothetical protein